jgi:hypothetical protein
LKPDSTNAAAVSISSFEKYCASRTYISQPIAIRVDAHTVAIERVRQRVGPHGERITTDDLIELEIVTPGGLAEEAAACGLEAEELRRIDETPEHVASQVVVFRG